MTTEQNDGPSAVLTDLILGIDHVGIAVPDLDTAVAMYTEVFGLVERHREVNAEQGVVEAMMAARPPPMGPPRCRCSPH